MKLIIALLVLFLSLNLYAQEEFFGDSSGVSFGYVKGFYLSGLQANGAGISFADKGFVVAAGINVLESISSPYLGILYYSNGGDPVSPRARIGLVYLRVDEVGVVGLDLGMVKSFYPKSNFPFSLSSSFTISLPLPTISKDEVVEFYNLMSIGYTQAFFAKNTIYPFISTAIGFDVDDNFYATSSAIMFGLNCRIE